MTERSFNLVVPLAHEATDMRIAETAGGVRNASGAVSPPSDRRGDVESTNGRSTPPTRTMPGTRTSTTATRTTTTRTTSSGPAPSADRTGRLPADFSFTELVEAYFDCRRNKRNSASALAFEASLERNLCDLYDELADGSYRPGRSICFVITRPKPREVWAAEFRDRVVHHLLYNHIGPRFEASFIADSCACITGRGTHYAARRLEAKIRSVTENWSRPVWYLKLDLANFFISINKRVLHDQLARRIVEPWWMQLIARIPRPLKELLSDYQEIEARVDTTVRATFGLPASMNADVKHADLVLLATERRDLMPADGTPWAILDGIEPLPRRIVAMQPSRAQAMFLKRYIELTTENRRTA